MALNAVIRNAVKNLQLDCRSLALLGMTALGCASFKPHPVEPTIRIVTYNIQAGAGQLDRIAGELKTMDADIALLQEVDVHWHQRSDFVDQASALAKSLGVEMRFAPIYRLPGDSGRPMREFGVALLSKHPIESFHNDPLTRLSTQQTNPVPTPMPGLLHATVNVRGARISVLTAHLDYRADPSVRRTQVAEILQVLERDTLPIIFAGDLNATPDAAELQPLFKRLSDPLPGFPSSGFTYPSSQPTKRIDYILLSRHFRVELANVAPVSVADHRPVSALVVLQRR